MADTNNILNSDNAPEPIGLYPRQTGWKFALKHHWRCRTTVEVNSLSTAIATELKYIAVVEK